MAIDPPSDIILDVVRAADPTRAAAVAQRLAQLGSEVAGAGSGFADTLDQTAANFPKSTVSSLPDPRSPFAPSVSPEARAAKTQVAFEASLLSGFVEQMLPKDASSVFGQGYAGDMWRTMLADKVAGQIAASGELGIGKRLFATHPMSASSQLGTPSRLGVVAHTAAQMSANDLASPSGADVHNGNILFSTAKAI